MCIAALATFISLISLGNSTIRTTRKFEPLLIAHLEYDPLLKIEKAMMLNYPIIFWAACPAEDKIDAEVEKSAVSKNAVFVKKSSNEKGLYDFKCQKPFEPVIVRNKFDNNILEIGFEVHFPESMPFEIDARQSNENIQPLKKSNLNYLGLSNFFTKSKAELQKLAWIPVLSIKFDEKNYVKEITYEILNAEYSFTPTKCDYDMKPGGNLINENVIFSELGNEEKIQSKTSFDASLTSSYKLEFLVSKNHLIVMGKQKAACTLQNLTSIWSAISLSWSLTNAFILKIAQLLDRLQVTVGTKGVARLSAQGYKQAIPKVNGNEIPAPEIIWRMVTYKIKIQRYSNDLEFGIIIVHHNEVVDHDESFICESCICNENNWKIKNGSKIGNIYCCPVNDETLEKLGVKGESKIVNPFNLREIFSIKEMYYDFDKTFELIDT